MRVAIDWGLCVGSGLCVRVDPDGLALTPTSGGQRAIVAGCPSDEALLAAARACPTLAIRLTDDEGRPLYPPPGMA